MQSLNPSSSGAPQPYQEATSSSAQQDGRISQAACALLDALENGADAKNENTITQLKDYVGGLDRANDERAAILRELPRILAQLTDGTDSFRGMKAMARNSVPRAYAAHLKKNILSIHSQEHLPFNLRNLNEREEEALNSKSDLIAMLTSLVNDYLKGNKASIFNRAIGMAKIIQDGILDILSRIGLSASEVKQLQELYQQACSSDSLEGLSARGTLLDGLKKVNTLSAVQSSGSGGGAMATTLRNQLGS